MEISGISNVKYFNGVSVLKTANEQPRLAGELISKSIESMIQNQYTPTAGQSVDLSSVTGTGKIINTTA
jgi:hypothetical protein